LVSSGSKRTVPTELQDASCLRYGIPKAAAACTRHSELETGCFLIESDMASLIVDRGGFEQPP
jgi:hypothetical protein